jgi:hypothetical protein
MVKSVLDLAAFGVLAVHFSKVALTAIATADEAWQQSHPTPIVGANGR